MSEPAIPLRAGSLYHIFNQGNNRENIFVEPRNYLYFFDKLREYVLPIGHIFAYCLLPNHFHLLIKIHNYDSLHESLPKRFPKPKFYFTFREGTRPEEREFDDMVSNLISRQFSDMFNGYTQAINKATNRRGKLFSLPFERVEISGEELITYLICYIHRNPVHHHFCEDYGIWPYSSYLEILELLKNGAIIGTPTAKATQVEKDIVVPNSILNLEFLGTWFQKSAYYSMLHDEAKGNWENKFLLE
ncbi:MAG: hypothetical protein GC192_20695 [Bacteroidetes bacterium]|nr:hypothetical protein [Bacteroidota bacterium]